VTTTSHTASATLPDEDPVLDVERLAEIADLDLFSPEVQAKLDVFARRAAERFDLPIGLVTIVLDSAQYFAGQHGTSDWIEEAQGTPVEWSFCANTVRDRAQYVVTDAEYDERQAHNPLVTEDGIRSYAGTPLTTSNGFVLGSYCVIGDTPREFTAEEMAELQRMAAEVVLDIENNHRLSTRSAAA
jgi:GAF domain-containing protein